MGNEIVTVVTKASDEFYHLLKATDKQKPKAEDVARLRKYLAQHPELGEVLGNLAIYVQNDLIKTAFTSQAVAMSAESYCEHQRQALGHATASPLEKLLIEQIVLCWLRLHEVALRYGVLRKNNPTITQVDHWERRVTLSQQRYLKAIETLAKVRKLMERTPAFQVNIAGQQVVTT